MKEIDQEIIDFIVSKRQENMYLGKYSAEDNTFEFQNITSIANVGIIILIHQIIQSKKRECCSV